MEGGGVRIEDMTTNQTKGTRGNGMMRGGGAGRREAAAGGEARGQPA